MKILTRNNRNFEKMSKNPSNRNKVKILGKFFLKVHKKNFVLVCLVIAKMFKPQNYGGNRRKGIEIFFKN